MKKKNDIYLHHILQSIHAIELYLKGISEKEFLSSTEKQIEELLIRKYE